MTKITAARSVRASLFRSLALAVTLLCTASASRAVAEETVGLGTVAPKSSLWGKVFSVWQEAVNKKSDGKLKLEIFYNGQQGDDATMIGKLKTGQLDGAAVSSVGLAKIHKPILALQMPGLFRSWAGLDKARDAVAPEFMKAAEAEGYYLSFGDLGRLRGMSKGFAVKRPSDLAGKNVLSWRGDKIGPQLWQQVKDVKLVELSATEVAPKLKVKGLDFLSAPTLAAEQLQWLASLDHIAKESSIMAMGGVVWSKKRIDALPGDLRTILLDTGAVAGAALKRKVRDEDEAAFKRASEKMTVVELSDSDRAEWQALFKSTIEKLKQGTFSPELVDRLLAMKE
jgi:TRAP-type C4-dicarboxylate transport system substrate-binding protein